jgi:hypothetical protein
MKKTTVQLNKDRAHWEQFSLWIVRSYLISNFDLINENIITKTGLKLYLNKLTLAKYIVKTNIMFIEKWKKFHKKASKNFETNDDVKRKIISALYKKFNEKRLWVDKKNTGIFTLYSTKFRIGERDSSKKNKKKYKDYIF